MAEDPSVLFVTRRIRRDFTQVQIVARVGRLLQHDAVRGGQILAHRFKCPARQPVLESNTRDHAEPLRLDEDLPFRALLRSHFVTEIVVRPQEPLAVPSMPPHGLLHACAFRQVAGRFFRVPAMPRDACEFLRRQHE